MRRAKFLLNWLLGKREAYISNINDTNNESKKKIIVRLLYTLI
jgi:hypothetical protein